MNLQSKVCGSVWFNISCLQKKKTDTWLSCSFILKSIAYLGINRVVNKVKNKKTNTKKE